MLIYAIYIYTVCVYIHGFIHSRLDLLFPLDRFSFRKDFQLGAAPEVGV